MSEKREVLLLVLGCDLDEDGFMLGWETEMRCRYAATIYHQFKTEGHKVTVITAAGKADPALYPDQTETMAQMMRNLMAFSACEVHQFDISVIEDPNGNIWGTKAELRTALEYQRKLADDGIASELHVVTSWYHCLRVRAISHFGFRKRIVTHGMWDIFIWNAMIEVPKLFIELLRLWWRDPDPLFV